MAHLPYDILHRVAEEIAAVDDSVDGHQLWPFDHFALLPSHLAGSLHAAKDLRACALVCRAWSAPLSAVNVRHLDIRRATPDAISNALSHDDRYSRVHHFQAGLECCPNCEALSVGRRASRGDKKVSTVECGNGVTMHTLLSTVSRCPNIRRLTIHEWAWGIEVDYSSYAPMTTITTFCSRPNAHASCLLDMRSFCHLLRLLPALKRLSFGRLDAADNGVDLDDMPTPDFKLESLAVTHADCFSDFEWLLANSRTTLRTYWVHGILKYARIGSCFDSITMVSATLRSLYYYGQYVDMTDVLRACTSLEELCIDVHHIQQGLFPYAKRIDPHPSLRRLVLATATVEPLRQNGRLVGAFFTVDTIQTLIQMLSHGVDAFPKLEALVIHTAPDTIIVKPPIPALRALRSACEARDVAFVFPLMAELEAEAETLTGSTER